MANLSPYVVVDLDGTLVKTDLFLEAMIRYVRRNPFHCLQLVVWLILGKHVAKTKISERVDIDAGHLPYEVEVLDYLRAVKETGASLLLATAAPIRYASAVADHLKMFDQVLASDDSVNLKGRRKLAAIRSWVGDQSFIYVGDSRDDEVIWQDAQGGVFVNASKQANRFRSESKVVGEIQTRPGWITSFRRQMRVHQWAKNLLLMLPLLVSHSYSSIAAIATAIVGLMSFCLCSSSVYFLNDLLDLHEDRQHVEKKNRPLAAGDLSLQTGVVGCFVLLAMAFCLGQFLPLQFMLWLLSYFVISTAYSVYLKKIWALDTITLAGLYTIRILAGAAAIALAPSFWLLCFSVFIFLGLAYLKRYVEFSKAPETTYGRGYTQKDSESLFSLGTANMTVSVLVLALFIHDPANSNYYQTPELLWVLCVVLMYWCNRIWFKARRGLVSDDPVIWTLNDNVSRMLAVACVLVVTVAKSMSLAL